MNLFRLRSEREHGEVRSLRTWLVIAGNLYEAMSLVPENFAVKTVKGRAWRRRGSCPSDRVDGCAHRQIAAAGCRSSTKRRRRLSCGIVTI